MKKNIVIKTNAQQGDVLLKRISKMPTGEQKILSKGRCVLAEGETTGHYHGIDVAETDAELIQIGEQMILALAAPATLNHQEHGPITLDAGLWEVGKVNEYDYFAQMKKKVVD